MQMKIQNFLLFGYWNFIVDIVLISLKRRI